MCDLPVSMIQISTGSCDLDEGRPWHLVKLDGRLGTEQAHNPAVINGQRSREGRESNRKRETEQEGD